MKFGAKPLLMVIDLQQAIDDPSWGVRNNPNAEVRVGELLAAWRSKRLPILHVRHMSTDPQSTYAPRQFGNEFKEVAVPLPGEEVLEKESNSAFIRTGLDARLRARGVSQIVIAGVITNNSVEATARMAGNLGYETVVVADATFTFGRQDFAGLYHPAALVHNLSLANMDGDYATVLFTEQVIGGLGQIG